MAPQERPATMLGAEFSALEKVPPDARVFGFWDQAALWFGAASLPAASGAPRVAPAPPGPLGARDHPPRPAPAPGAPVRGLLHLLAGLPRGDRDPPLDDHTRGLLPREAGAV